jgi:glycerophosphoryl diester phosphodiesterase
MVTIVAHRGAPKRARENTLKSFLTAASLGAEMVELDVRRTSDGIPIIFHDPWLSRKTRRPLIAHLTYQEINRRVSKKKFHVPTLEETLKALAGKVMLDIELKEPGYETEVIKLVRRWFPDDRFILTSFHPGIINAVKSFDQKLTAGLILAKSKDLPFGEKTEADVLAPEKGLFISQRKIFADFKKKGKRIAVWTVDGKGLLSNLLVDPLVDAVITNYPDRALSLRTKLCPT